MKKKVLLILITIFSIIILSGCKPKELILSLELSGHSTALSANLDETNKLTSAVDVSVSIYTDATEPTPYYISESSSLLKLDNEEGYLSLSSTFGDVGGDKEIYQSIPNGTLHIYTEEQILYSEVLPETDDLLSLISDSSDTETSYILLDSEDAISKDEDSGIYTINIQVSSLVDSDILILDQMLGSNTVDDLIESNVTLIFTYAFNTDDTELVQTIDIPRYLDKVYDAYISISIETTITVVDSIEQEIINPNSYSTTGPSSIDLPMFTLEPRKEHTIFIENSEDNYFSYHLEVGYYVIDSEYRMQNYVDIEVYDSEGHLVEGNNIYQIVDEGTYYINFIQKKYSNIEELIYVYKIDETFIGTPMNPIVTTNNTLTLSQDSNNVFLLMEEAPADGVLVLRTSEASNNMQYAKLASQGTYMVWDSTWNTGQKYGFLQVSEGDTVILEFDEGRYDSGTISWYFLSQETYHTDLSSMPEISLTEPTLIYLTNDNSMVNYKITITEEGDYSFFPTMEYIEAEWGSYSLAVYDSDFNLVSYDIQLDPVHLTAGTYILTIYDIDKIHYYPFLREESEYNFIIFALQTWVNN